jgi:hypothetical protein
MVMLMLFEGGRLFANISEEHAASVLKVEVTGVRIWSNYEG